jgi:hypothetical protein
MRAIAVAVLLISASAAADPIIAAADAFACARTSDGAVKCWGDAPGGEQPTPTAIAGFADIAGIAAARGRVLAWTKTGELLEWNGALTRVAIKNVVLAAVSTDAACALRGDGSVACWLGTNLPDDAIIGATQLAVAGHQACARVGDDVSCWTIGRDPAKAQVVAAAHGAVALAGYDRGERGPTFVAAVAHHLAAWSWTFVDNAGVIDIGALATKPVPAVGDATAVAIGETDACALGASVTCWSDDAKPRKLDVANAKAIAIGDGVGCAAMPDHDVRCWGQQVAVGIGVGANIETPVDASGIADAVQLAASGETACVRRANGHVACWGSRLTEDGRTRGIDLAPRDVPGIADAREIFVGRRIACARRVNNRVACWGHDGTALRTRPTDMPALARASWLGVLEADVCGLVDGALVCGARTDTSFAIPKGTTELWRGSWYRGTYQCARVTGAPKLACEQLWSGRGGQIDHNPIELAIETTDVAALQLPVMQEIPSVCVANHKGDVACASLSGDAPTTPTVTGVTAFGEGPQHVFDGFGATCVVTGDHGVACWAEPTNVQRVNGITDAIEVGGGDLFACARRTSGKVSCWGDSNFVGSGDRATTSTPAIVPNVTL